MTYDLAIGDRAYSSWSLRGWLLFDAFDIPVRCHIARLYTDELPQLLAKFVPARSVPVMRTPDGQVVPDSLAIAEELASRHPEAGHWPRGPARAVARVLAAEMHAGFSALRNHCPMNLRVSYQDCAPPEPVLADLARLEAIWAWARTETGTEGAWLCGAYSAADVFFAPIAARIASITCRSALRLGPMSRPTLSTRRSAAGALWGLSMVSIRSFTAETIRRAHGPDQCRWQHAPCHTVRPKTPPAPIPANRFAISWNWADAYSASAIHSAATKPSPTPRHGPNSWPFTLLKPIRPSR